MPDRIKNDISDQKSAPRVEHCCVLDKGGFTIMEFVGFVSPKCSRNLSGAPVVISFMLLEHFGLASSDGFCRVICFEWTISHPTHVTGDRNNLLLWPTHLHLICNMDENDTIETTLPIYLSGSLDQNLHIFQYPLLSRPLEVPPSAALTGKRIKARHKPKAGRYEVQVPNDTREEVWNVDRGRELGQARADEDAAQAAAGEEQAKGKKRDYEREEREREEQRLGEVRLRSEKLESTSVYMLGVVRDGESSEIMCIAYLFIETGKLYLHPVHDVLQLRPSLTYLDALSKKQKRARGEDSDDEGPPPDPDEPAPSSSVPKKTESKEVLVMARKTDDKSGNQTVGGLSAIRREMLNIIREEQEEQWQNLDYKGIQTRQSAEWLDEIFSTNEEVMKCTTSASEMLSSINGLLPEQL
ncbi:sin-like protein conserved region domain-containing protein [Rhizoctonia solani AG-1 IA]|uniref:Sin-like protein conserved region domain-containing protein n=1 Tax=Thanatephorus cucumeris (strain AG1-IA) TaxID=983506 RepID=L8WX93_THACA|nr:sin-like protein conserved region domain-containing protein [Rhizoctonia solani AG-1 IA]